MWSIMKRGVESIQAVENRNAMQETNQEEKQQPPAEVKKGWSKKEILVGSAGILATIALCVVGFIYKDYLTDMKLIGAYGLLGLFIIAFVGSSTFTVTAVPIPFWLLVMALPSIMAKQWGLLAPVWISLVTGIAIASGQIITYMIGYGGRSLSAKISSRFSGNFYNKLMRWAQKHGSWAVFLMSVAVNPIHLPMTLAIAALGYPPYKFFIFSFLGALVKSLVFAYCGYFGFNQLLSIIGID